MCCGCRHRGAPSDAATCRSIAKDVAAGLCCVSLGVIGCQFISPWMAWTKRDPGLGIVVLYCSLSMTLLWSGSVGRYFGGRDLRLGVPPGAEAIGKLPRMRLDLDLERSDTLLDAQDRSCLICLQDFDDGDECMVLPCFHRYHTLCVERWLEDNATCPSCRCDVAVAMRGLL